MNSDDTKTPTSDPFCINPFLEINITPAGSVRACCAFYPVISKNGHPMSVYEHSIEEIWNSDTMRSVRRDMIDGKPVMACEYCYKQEQKGAASMRTDGLSAWQAGYLNPRQETIEDLKAKATRNDYRLPAGPEWIDLDVGNLCNLKCRMCNSLSSSGIANDPVHARWPYLDHAATARWQGRAMIVAPARVLGVEYEGFSPLDLSYAIPVSWIENTASLRVKQALGEASSVQIKLAGVETARCERVEIFVNEILIYHGVLSSVPIDIILELPTQITDGETFFLRVTSTGRVGVEEIKLLRTSTGSSNVGLSRFADGKQWFQDETFLFNELLYKVDNITKMNFIGGEPFLIKEVRAVMRHLISLGAAKNITLSMTTNGTIADDEICELMGQFKNVICAVSLDGFEAVNDYVRSPSRWETLQPNIRRLQKIENAYLYVNMTVQAYNMLHVARLAQYCEEMDMDLRYHFLEIPNHLSCLVTPIEARQAAANRLRAFALKNMPDTTQRIRRNMDIKNTLLGLADILEANVAPADPRLVDDFMTFTNDLDASRNQNFASVNQELYDFFEAAGSRWNSKTRFAQYAKGGGFSL